MHMILPVPTATSHFSLMCVTDRRKFTVNSWDYATESGRDNTLTQNMMPALPDLATQA